MIHKVYSIFDQCVSVYSQPFCGINKGHALRYFSQLIQDKSTNLNKYPHEHVLFEIGEYDDAKGVMLPYSSPISVGVASEYVSSEIS